MTSIQLDSVRSLPIWEKMLDIPLFLDGEAIDLLYDGLVRPLHTNAEITLSITAENAKDVETAIKAHGKLGQGFLSGALAKFELGGELQRDTTDRAKKGEGTVIRLEPVKTPVRRLEQILLAYTVQYPHRILKGFNWDEMTLEASPKYLAEIQLPPGTKIIPTAAEFADGSVVQIFPKIAPSSPSAYPEKPLNADAALYAYWQGFADSFNAQKAMEAIEAAQMSHGKLSWIDYRIEMAGKFVHIHACPRGKYDTGVFAYNFVKRGYKHGICLLGVLRKEPDLHVLAIYEN